MAVDVPGLVAVVCFLKIFSSRSPKSKKVQKTCDGNKNKVTIVGSQKISILVGVPTLTGRTFELIDHYCFQYVFFPALHVFDCVFVNLFIFSTFRLATQVGA